MSVALARERQRVIIVDVSNLRDRRRGAERAPLRVSETGEVKHETLANWVFIESAISAIREIALHSAVILVADKSLGHKFSIDQRRDERFFRHAELHWSHPDFIYALPSKRELAAWRDDGDQSHGVQADELILFLAAELNGFVISGDRFSEPQYQEYLERIDNRTFSPEIEDDGHSVVWRLVLTRDLVSRSYSDESGDLGDLRQLDYDIESLPALSDQQIVAIREEIFGDGGLENRFWQHYGRRFGIPETKYPPSRGGTRRRRPGDTMRSPSLTSRPFEMLKNVIGVGSGGRAAPVDVSSEINRRFIFAYDQPALQDAVDVHVTVLGRISDHAGSARLCWYGGNDGIAVSNLPAGVDRHDKGFVQVRGLIRKRLTRLELEVASGSVVERVDFRRVVQLLEDDVPKWQSPPLRKWHFPRLPRRSDPVPRTSRTHKPPVVPPFDPRRPRIAPPGRAWVARSSAPQGPQSPTSAPLPPTVNTLAEPPRRRPRRVTVILIALLLAAASAAGYFLTSEFRSSELESAPRPSSVVSGDS
jgi:hypothetical protein